MLSVLHSWEEWATSLSHNIKCTWPQLHALVRLLLSLASMISRMNFASCELSLKSRAIPAPLPNLMPINVKQNWDRKQCHRQESQQTRRPIHAKVMIPVTQVNARHMYIEGEKVILTCLSQTAGIQHQENS